MTMGINLGTEYFSERQRATVSNRGAGFGDIYLGSAADEIEVRFLWSSTGTISVAGHGIPTRAQRNRAVRALAETELGRKALGIPEGYDPMSVPSADEEELEELRAAARAAGLIPDSTAPAPTPVPAPAAPASRKVVTSVDGVTVEVSVTVER